MENGYEIINVDCLTYAGSETNVETVSEMRGYSFVNANICDSRRINEVFDRYKPDAVMHLAAESHVDRSIDTPRTFIDTNIVGTYNMLEASLNYWNNNAQSANFRFQHISTDEVFGTLKYGSQEKFTEDTNYKPRSPYAASKASSDHLVRAWHETYGLPILLTNCSNNYGPYQFPDKLIPVIIISLLTGSKIPVYGKGINIRDWLYVEDHAEALLTVFERGQSGRTYAIGGENEVTNLNIIKKIHDILKVEKITTPPLNEILEFVEDRPGHDQRYAIDPIRIKSELGWAPKVSLDEGLEKTVRWYLDNEKWWRPFVKGSEVVKRQGTLKNN